MKRALLDTSFVISLARAEKTSRSMTHPMRPPFSALTLCGLHHGALVATDEQRPGRLATLIFAERRFAALPIDARVAPHYGRLLADVRRRRGHKLQIGRRSNRRNRRRACLPLITRDRDFAKLDGVNAIARLTGQPRLIERASLPSTSGLDAELRRADLPCGRQSLY